MSINMNIKDLEYDKFDLDENGKVIVRTSATGDFSTSGLKTGIRTTTMLVGTTAVKLPAIALAGRNSMTIHNKSESQILYIGGSNVTADSVIGTTGGAEIGPGSFWNTDIKGSIEIYGRVDSGSILIKITEVA